MTRDIYHFIGGKMKEGTGSRKKAVYNPATGEVIGYCPLATTEEVNEAVKEAEKGFKQWRKMNMTKRMEVLHRFRQLLVDHRDDFIHEIGRENGKTIVDAEGELNRAIESVDFALSVPQLLKGEYSTNVATDIHTFSIKQPLGVVVCISPFNFPIMVPAAMSTMAVACGNAVILKPSEKVPNSALLLSKLWKEAGLPDGVWSVVNGDKEAVDALVTHPSTQAVSFVGSTPVAKYIYELGTKHHKRVAAFGGGKNHMVIMPDADMDNAVNNFIGAAYGAASQRCMALSVAMPVGEKTANEFVAKLKQRVEELKVGTYEDETSDFGPVISREAKESVLEAIQRGLEDGAELVVDGRTPNNDVSESGFFLGATLLDNVTPNMNIYKEEVFGPARIVVRVKSLDEAIDLVNDHKYGNGVTIFTQNGSAAREFYENIEVGMVGVNVPIPIPVGYHNFAGWKQSRFGEGHMFGPDTARFFTKTKTVTERWPKVDGEIEKASFSFPSNETNRRTTNAP